MVRPHSFDSEIEKARAALTDAINGMAAADAALAVHSRGGDHLEAINFPVEEDMVRETVTLLDRAKSLCVSLLKELDMATATADLQYRRLFDEKAGLDTSGFLGRTIAQGHARPASIAADLDVLLAASAVLDTLFKTTRPAFVQHHRASEDHIDRLIERRQRFDFDIEEAQRQADRLTPDIADRRNSLLFGQDPDALAAVREEHETLVAQRDTFIGRERELQPARGALQRLIDIYEELVEKLNAQIGAINAMTGKLTVDIEQRIALSKAVSAEIVPPQPAVARPAAAVAALISAFEANVLAGHDLAARKARADDVFTQRLEPHLLSPPALGANEEAETAPDA